MQRDSFGLVAESIMPERLLSGPRAKQKELAVQEQDFGPTPEGMNNPQL